MHQIRFRLGLCPRSRWGSLQCSPDPLAGFRGPTSKGKGGKESGWEEMGGERMGRKEEGGREEGEGEGERNKNPPSDRFGYGPAHDHRHGAKT